MKLRTLSALFSGMSFVAFTAMASAQTTYLFTSLGSLPTERESSAAYAINNFGQVVGTSSPGAVSMYAGQPVQNLGTLGGIFGTAYGINDSGQIVGRANNASEQYRPFLTTVGGTMIDLGDLGNKPDAQGFATGINNSGQIVGQIEAIIGDVHTVRAFVTTAGGPMQDLGSLNPLGGHSWAAAINNAGQIVGETATLSGAVAAFLTTAGGTMVNIGDFFPTALNDYGMVVGWNWQGSQHAAYYTTGNGLLTDLGSLPGSDFGARALGIGNSGLIVGTAFDSNLSSRAFFTHAGDGILTDLNDFVVGADGYTLTSANGINDRGQIVGTAFKSIPGWGGVHEAFILTPMAAVPEPSTWALVMGGVTFGVAMVRRRLRR